MFEVLNGKMKKNGHPNGFYTFANSMWIYCFVNDYVPSTETGTYFKVMR